MYKGVCQGRAEGDRGDLNYRTYQVNSYIVKEADVFCNNHNVIIVIEEENVSE